MSAALPSRPGSLLALLAAGLLLSLLPPSPARSDTIESHTIARYARFEPLSAYDTRRHRVVQFGGDAKSFPAPGFDVSVFDPADGGGWSAPLVTGTPPDVQNGCAVYDSTRDRVLVFADEGGGVWSLSCAPPMTWQALSPAGTAPRFAEGGAIYDPVGDRVVGFGGLSADGQTSLGVAWALSLAGTPTWSTLTTAGITPMARDRAACLFDPGQDRMVVFGGESVVGGTSTTLQDVATLTFAGGTPTWSTIPIGPVKPAAVLDPLIAFDAAGERMFLFGGLRGSEFTETWRLTFAAGSATWQQQSASPTPQTRYGGIGLFDPAGDRMVMVSGAIDAGHANPVAEALAVDELPLTWTQLEVRGSLAVATYPAAFGAYEPSHRRFFAQLSVNGGTNTPSRTPWFLALDDSTWTPATGLGLPPIFSPFESFYDVRRGTFYCTSGDSLYWFQPDGDRTWKRAGIAGTVPIVPDRFLDTYYDEASQRYFLFGGKNLSTFGTASQQLAELSLTPTPQWTILSNNSPYYNVQTPPTLDTRRNRLLFFGGAFYTTTNSPPDAENGLSQFDLGTLTFTTLSPGGSPPAPRYAFAAAYDSLRDRMMVFGGGAFANPQPSVYYLQFGPSDPNGSWYRNDPTGADLPGFFGPTLGAFDPALDSYPVAGVPTFYAIHPAAPAPLVSVECPPRTAWTPGQVLPLTFHLAQSVNAPHDYALRVDSPRAWPGFPLTATQSLSLAGGVDVPVGIPVPDTAAAGLDSLRFTVYDLADPTLRDSCGTTIGDISSPVMWAITGSAVGAGSVSITWWVADHTAANARIERRVEAEPWAFLANVPVRSDGQVALTDATVTAGARYDYRAGIASAVAGGYDWSPDAWVTVPAAGPVALAFARRGVLVARGALEVSFTLPAAGVARIDAYDLRGRRVASGAVNAAQGGAYSLRVPDAGTLRSGIYFLRLTQGGRSVQGRALVLPAP